MFWQDSAVARPGTSSFFEEIRQTKRRRVRLTVSVALYGGVVSVATLYISLTALPSSTYPFEPQRPSLLHFLFASIGAVLSGVVLAGVATHFVADSPNQAPHPLIWVLIGVLYGVLVPFITGMFRPFWVVLLDLVTGTIGEGGLWLRLANAAFYAPFSSVYWGVIGLPAGLLGGLLLAVGAWFIALANAAVNPRIARYGPWVISVALSLGVLATALLAPLSLVASLG